MVTFYLSTTCHSLIWALPLPTITAEKHIWPAPYPTSPRTFIAGHLAPAMPSKSEPLAHPTGLGISPPPLSMPSWWLLFLSLHTGSGRQSPQELWPDFP